MTNTGSQRSPVYPASNHNQPPLPAGWVWTVIGEVANTTSGGTPSRKRSDYYGGSIPWVKSGELNDRVINSVEESITPEALRSSSAKVFPEGTPLVALYGATVGRTGILGIAAATNQAVCALFPLEGAFLAKYMMYWLRSQREALIGLSAGGAQPNISQGIIRNHPFPLAPLAEQHRIVAEIEKQFTRLDAAVAALTRLQAHLRQYRASVLKAACSGRLVPQDPNDEPADQLLQRTLAERRHKWTANHPNKKYREPAMPETTDFQELPQGWVWATVEQLASDQPRSIQSGPFGSNLLHSEFQDTGILAIGIDNVLEMQFSLGSQHRISLAKYQELRKYEAQPLDVLMTVMATVGRCCVVPESIETAIITKHVYRITVDRTLVDPYYLMYCLSGGHEVRRQMFGSVRGQTRPGINGTILKKLAIPVPPLAEQERVVAEIERRLSVIEAIEQVISDSLGRAGRLRQAILQLAFSGRLVPQPDPAGLLRPAGSSEESSDESADESSDPTVPDPVGLLRPTGSSEGEV